MRGEDGAKRDNIYEYLKDVLPQNKTEEQKIRYVGRLLVEMNEKKNNWQNRSKMDLEIVKKNGRIKENPTEIIESDRISTDL